ncbi:MAG: DegV family protein [Clostridiales bacterium]|nr:DegV family protein [Clostridiales bacterium]
MKIAVSVESTNDLPKELLEKYDIKVIPYTVILGDNEVKDGTISTSEIFEFVKATGVLPKTTALNEFEYTEYFETLKKDYDAVVHIALSSGLSSSCGNATRASNNLQDVYVVDSLSLSTGIGLLAIYARELASQGLSAKEVAEKVAKRRENLQVSFVVERLDYLFKGGRCSSLQLLGANILKIRPRIALKDGKMGMDKKYRGSMSKVIAQYCQEILAEKCTPDLERVLITYSSATPEMVKEATDACKSAGFKNVYEATAGATVTSHCGENTLGIIYFNDGE